MKTGNRFLLACEGVMTKKVRTFMLGLGVSVGTAALVFLVSLIFGAKSYVDQKVGEIRENLLNVYEKNPPPANPRPLGDSAYRELSRIAGVNVHRVLPVDPRPAIKVKGTGPIKLPKIDGMDINLFQKRSVNPIPNFEYRRVEPLEESEATFPQAAESNTVEEDDDFVPVIVPNLFMQWVDALAGGDPEIAELLENLVKGKEPFYIVLDNRQAYRCKVVAQDNLVEGPTLAVPFQYAVEWNGIQAPGRSLPNFSRIVLEAKDIKDLDAIRESVSTAGFHPEPTEAQRLSITVTRSVAYLFIVAVTFCLVIALVSAIGIFNGLSISIMEQATRIGILRSVGATRHDISTTYLIEAAFIGIMGGLIGLVAAHLLMWGSDIALKDLLSDATNIRDIDTLFSWDILTAFLIRVGATGLGVVTSLLAGVGPAYRASRLNPAVVLREG